MPPGPLRRRKRIWTTRGDIKEALTFGWKKLTIVVRLPVIQAQQSNPALSAANEFLRDVSSFVQNTEQNHDIVLEAVVVNQDVWRDGWRCGRLGQASPAVLRFVGI
jgi:hypothetical protein